MIKDKPVLVFIILAFVLLSMPRLCAQNSTMSPGEAAIARKNMVDYSKKYIGCPYVSGATGPSSFDCSGFVYAVSRESIGIQLPRTVKAIYNFCSEIKDSEREAGDLVFFKTTGSGEVSHVGLYIGNNQFIHCASDGPNTGVIVSSLKESYWKAHYFCARRYITASNSELLTDPVTKEKIREEVVVPEKASAASGNKNSVYSSANRGNSFLSSLIFDATLNFDWNFFLPDSFRLNARGFDLMAHATYNGTSFKPGLGTYFRFDAGTGNIQLPLVLSLTLSDYVRIFAGPVFTLGSPSLPGKSEEEISNSVFPGILGICWNTPSFKVGKTLVSFSQDIHYTVFNKTSNGALSPKKTIPTGLVFATGVRVTLPMKNVL